MACVKIPMRGSLSFIVAHIKCAWGFSASGKTSSYFDFFPFVFGSLPLRDRYYRQEKMKTSVRRFTSCR